ncbi:MAG TPA: tetratricopeptide repeat protein, partial [Myxococcota bacterium]|nr:tetratricopeptide repeat protein [Myxococcota bacterium]
MTVAMLIRSLVCLAVALASVSSADRARAEAVRVEVDMMCPVLSVKTDASGNLLLEIARGTRHGLVKGARGDIYEPQAKSGVGQVIARAELITVGPEVSIARTVPGTVVDPAKVIPRAQVEVRALLPKNVHRGQLFKLYLNGIEFLDNMRQPIVDPMLLLTDTTGEVEKKALANMVGAGREVVEFTLDMAQVQTRTRWKGKLVHEILTNNDERDYREFLRFVADYPGKYIGQAWKISETYATWLINFSPPAAIDRYEELRDARPADFTSLVKAMSEADFTWIIKWLRLRISEHSKSQLAESQAMQKLADRIIKARGGLAKQTPKIRAEWLHIMARVQDDVPGKTQEAARLYKETSAAYLAVGEEETTLEAVIARNNHLGQLNVLGKDEEVLTELAVIQAMIREHLPRMQNPMYKIHLESADDFPAKIAAAIYKKQGRYRDIIALLSPMVERIAKVGARGARDEEMEMRELIAAAHDRLGEVERADELYRGIVVLAAELGDNERQASALFAIGDMYHKSGRYERSAERFRESAEIGQRAGLQKAQAKGLAAEGQALWNMGKLGDALNRHREAMALREAIGDESGIAWQSVQVAKIQLESGDREAARQAFERAIALQAKLGDTSSEADTRLELGDLYMTLKQPDKALVEFTQARDAQKKLGQRVREAGAIQKMASATMNAGDHAAADKLIGLAIALLEKTGDKRELANARLWLARVRHNAGDPKSARQLIESVMPRDPGLDPSMAIDALTELVSLEVSYGSPDKALSLALQAMALAEKNQDAWRMNSALHALRNAYGALGDLAKQEEVMTRALTLAEQSGNKPFMVSALQQLAWVYSDTGRLAEGKSYAERAVALARETDDPFEVAWSLNTLSKVLQGYNDVKAELAALEEAHRLVTRVNYRYGLAAITFNRALTYARLRDLQRALDGYREAEQALTGTLDTQFEVALPSARGEALMLLGRYDEAQKSLTIALGKARAKNPVRVPILLGHLARLESSRGRHEAALRWAEEAVQVEEQRTTASSGARAML